MPGHSPWIQGLKRFFGVPVQEDSNGETDPGAAVSVMAEADAETETPEEWKRKALADFSAWLADLPDTPPAAESAGMDACDLYTLLTEFSALRQEIRMQNREQRRGIKALDGHSQAVEEQVDALRRIGADSGRTAEQLHAAVSALESGMLARINRGLDEIQCREVQKQTVTPFLDIRGALIRGRDAAITACAPSGLFRRRVREMDGVVEGYEMALRRFDRALFAVGVRPVEARGKPFDPKTMRAIETRKVSGMEKGIVVEEQLAGFIRGEEVIQTAEVVVSE